MAPAPRKAKTNLPIAELRVPAAYLSQWIEKSGYTQRQLAKILGVSEPSVSRWATGSIEVPVAAAKTLALMGVNPIAVCPEIRRVIEILDLYDTHRQDREENPFVVAPDA